MAKPVFHTEPSDLEVEALDKIGEVLDELEMPDAISVVAIWLATALAAYETKDERLPLYWLGAFGVALAEARREVDKAGAQRLEDP